MTVVLQFHHDFIGQDLYVQTGADNINWTYTLNTQRYPTYGGEVVQILSCFVDTLTVQGTCERQMTGDYTNPGMEDIYTWFLKYMQGASQGGAGTIAYTERYITMAYPARNWVVNIQLQSLPGYLLDRDTVAPTWQISGKVVEEIGSGMSLDDILTGGGGFGNGVGADVQAFKNLQDGVSLKYPDPSQSPFTSPFQGKVTPAQIKSLQDSISKDLGNQFSQIVQSWSNGDYSSFLGAQPSQFSNGAAVSPHNVNKPTVTHKAGKAKH
jgi:hypothetical protein